MKIFLDTANKDAIAYWVPTGLIDGVTTNPTHLSKEDNDPTQQVRAICALLPKGVISVEVVETDPEAVYSQAKAIAKLANNIAVKIPCHKNYYGVIKRLVGEGVIINVTLVFSLSQGLMMAKLGVHYISPFVGRLDDAGVDGLRLVNQLVYMMDYYKCKTQVLAASIRDIGHFEGAVLAGAHVVTVPVDVFEQSLEHPLTDKGMTQFLSDWKKLSIKQFPSVV